MKSTARSAVAFAHWHIAAVNLSWFDDWVNSLTVYVVSLKVWLLKTVFHVGNLCIKKERTHSGCIVLANLHGFQYYVGRAAGWCSSNQVISYELIGERDPFLEWMNMEQSDVLVRNYLGI
ncbi:hypothetical protein Droror1_Dr00013136 [Drosera rotundifolia]